MLMIEAVFQSFRNSNYLHPFSIYMSFLLPDNGDDDTMILAINFCLNLLKLTFRQLIVLLTPLTFPDPLVCTLQLCNRDAVNWLKAKSCAAVDVSREVGAA